MGSGNQTEAPRNLREDRIFKEGYNAGERDTAMRVGKSVYPETIGDCRTADAFPQHLGALRAQTIEERVRDLFTYHAPGADELTAYDSIRTGARHFAEILLKNTPPSKDQDAALNKLRVVVMLANASIALDGRS